MRVACLLVCLFLSACFSASPARAQSAPPALQIRPLTGDFYVYITYGDAGGGQPYPANGMYLVTKQGVVLFDTPWDTTQFQPLLDSIRHRHGRPVVLCLATHFHEDRTAGLAYYRSKGIATYTSVATDKLSAEHHKPRAQHLLAGDTSFRIGGYRFDVIYPGKGHSPDNIVAWFPEQKVLYGGCFIKSVESPGPGNLSDADVQAWIPSIKKVMERCPSPRFVIPGHQDWTDPRSVQHTLAILERFLRENQ